MNTHPFDTEFSVTPEQKEQFRRDGFVKLEGLFNADAVNALLNRVEAEIGGGRGIKNAQVNYMFTRVKYDFETEKDLVYELMERPYFRRALTEIVEHDLFLTFEMCFELNKNVDRGLPWHVGIQSFSYQVAEELAYTLWTPLHPIDAKGQKGGMAYVPQNLLSGSYVYQFEPAIVSTMKAKERAGISTSITEYFKMRGAVLNGPPTVEILENHQVEDDFQPGDALLFNKNVVHRSVRLGEGTLPRRAAYVMRFVDAGSHYDLQRAKTADFAEEQYGKGQSGYKSFTRQHIEIAEAGAQDGDLLAECAYFDNRDRRTLRRQPSS